MKKIIYVTITTIACMAVCGGRTALAQTPTTDPGVEIEGVVWATRNVAEKGRFTDNPENYGDYFAHRDALTACPEGWRVPTKEELFKLIDVRSEWTSVNGINGRRFGDGEATIFLPAAGTKSESGPQPILGVFGQYPSTTPPDTSGTEHGISFWDRFDEVAPSSGGNAVHSSVRCVRE